MQNPEIMKLNEKAKKHAEQLNNLVEELKKVIVGQEAVLQKTVMALIGNGHVLMEGVPGLAKTLIVKTLAETINTRFQRIQFTPDLLPADIIGTKIFNMRTNAFTTKKGPIFTNLLLADEINRAPAKCQSALLEAMQERQVTIGEDTYKLESLFFVIATMNPLEHEGVYQLPEAQVDRFMFKLVIGYPSKEEEKLILNRFTEGKEPQAKQIIKAAELLEIQNFVKSIYADEKIKQYVVDIVDATRNPEHLDVNGLIDFGASPRASLWLTMGGKARALINGRGYVIPEDIQAVAHDVLRHRLLLSYEAEAEQVTSDAIIDKILKTVKVP